MRRQFKKIKIKYTHKRVAAFFRKKKRIRIPKLLVVSGKLKIKGVAGLIGITKYYTRYTKITLKYKKYLRYNLIKEYRTGKYRELTVSIKRKTFKISNVRYPLL